MPVVGFLYTGDSNADADLAARFRNGLREVGYIEGQNVAIEYRWARDDNSQLLEMIDDLVRRASGCYRRDGQPGSHVWLRRPDDTIVFDHRTLTPVQAGIVAQFSSAAAPHHRYHYFKQPDRDKVARAVS